MKDLRSFSQIKENQLLTLYDVNNSKTKPQEILPVFRYLLTIKVDLLDGSWADWVTTKRGHALSDWSPSGFSKNHLKEANSAPWASHT